jgi:prepilin-type N-terminal cleavage/methylation domain-containing protein
MQLNKMRTVSKPSGFTLIELLVVIAIIAIIGAIGVPAYNGYIADARDKAAQATLQSIVLMQKNYYQDNFCYVATGAGADVGPKINQYLFGTPEAESTTAPIDTTLKNFFYFEITGTASTACPDSGTPKLAKNFVVKAINRSDTSKWFTINHKLTKLDQDSNTW